MSVAFPLSSLGSGQVSYTPPKGRHAPRTFPTSLLPLWENVFSFCHFPLTLCWLDTLFMDVIYCISELILCSAIVKHFCGPVPQGDIYFFSPLMFWLTFFSLSFLRFASCFLISSILDWNMQRTSSGNKTSSENDNNWSIFILMRQLYSFAHGQ